MKLTESQIAIVASAANIAPVPDDHEFAADLCSRFGDHTFYLGSGGLYIAEPFDVEIPGSEPVVFYRIAAWVDEKRESLTPIEPERQDHAVDQTGSIS